MTQITLYNTAKRQKESFQSIDDQNVRMYVCGPTVYDRAHLGNARPVVVFDVLYRLLRHVYGADHVTYVRNFTDVDDKINARAAQSGRPIGEITAETIQWFLDDMGALGALEPSIRNDPDHQKAMPRATQYIPQIVTVIEDHPEYQQLMTDAVLDAAFTPEEGQTNPFLHMGLHLAIREQFATDRPPGIAALFNDLLIKTGDAHDAEHRALECLAETLWEAQSGNAMPDEAAYLEKLRKL